MFLIQLLFDAPCLSFFFFGGPKFHLSKRIIRQKEWAVWWHVPTTLFYTAKGTKKAHSVKNRKIYSHLKNISWNQSNSVVSLSKHGILWKNRESKITKFPQRIHPLIASSKNLWKKERGRTLGTYLGLLWTMEKGSFLHSVLFFLLRFIICNY